MTNRRDFMKIVMGGITFSLLPQIKAPIEAKTVAPATTILGKELASPVLLKEGWYKVVIDNVDFKPSRMNPEEMNIWFECSTVDTGQKLAKIISSRAPMFALDFVKRLNLLPIHDGYDLTQAIGKTVDVKVKQQKYMNKYVNSVE